LPGFCKRALAANNPVTNRGGGKKEILVLDFDSPVAPKKLRVAATSSASRRRLSHSVSPVARKPAIGINKESHTNGGGVWPLEGEKKLKEFA